MRWKIQDLFDAIERGRRFATYDVWRIGRPGEEVPSGFIIKQIRVAILLVSNLWRGTVMLRASALTFATILAIVPSLAIMFYIIQTFELDKAIFEAAKSRVEGFVETASDFVRPEQLPEDAIEPPPGEGVGEAAPAEDAAAGAETRTEAPPPEEEEAAAPTEDTPPADATAADAQDPEATFRRLTQQMLFPELEAPDTDSIDPVQELFNLASSLADKAAGDPSGLLISGIILFFTTVLGLMRNIEKSFNDIWGVRRTRSWFRMVGDYMLITILLPFVAALIMGVTAALQTDTVQEELGPFAVLVRGSQFAVIWFMFSTLYFVVPNTRVRPGYALLGGLVAGAIWVLLSWGFVTFQFGLARYSVVYSTFAQVPMVLIWIYLSWTILLFGAELTFAYQNEKTFAMERYSEEASYAYREALALRAMLDVAQRFEAGERGLAPELAAPRLNVPTRLLNDIMEELENAGLVIPCATEPLTYQPARALSKIAVHDVVKAMRETGRDPSMLLDDEEVKQLTREVEREEGRDGKTTFAELVERYPMQTDEEEQRTVPFESRESKS